MMPQAIGPGPGRRAVLASGCAAALWAAGRGRSRAAAAEPVAITVTLSSNSFGAAAPFLADKLGLFDKHGLSARLVVMDSGSLAVSAVVSGSAQFTVSGVSDALTAAAHGRQMKLVANVYHGLSGSVVIAKAVADKLGVRTDSPLEARYRALDGLSVAIPSPTSSYVPPVVGAAAMAHGKAELVYMAQPTMVAALQAGAVQGLMAGSPFWEPAVTSGAGLLLLDGPSGDFPPDAAPVSTLALETTAGYASAHPDTVAAAQAVFDDLAQQIGSDPGAVRKALAQAYPQLAPATIDLSFKRNLRNWAHPGFSVADVEHEMAMLRRSGLGVQLDGVDPQALLLAGS